MVWLAEVRWHRAGFADHRKSDLSEVHLQCVFQRNRVTLNERLPLFVKVKDDAKAKIQPFNRDPNMLS